MEEPFLRVRNYFIQFLLLKWKEWDRKNKTCLAWCCKLGKKKTELTTNLHAQCMLNEERGRFCFLRAISKKAPKRQIIN